MAASNLSTLGGYIPGSIMPRKIRLGLPALSLRDRHIDLDVWVEVGLDDHAYPL